MCDKDLGTAKVAHAGEYNQAQAASISPTYELERQKERLIRRLIDVQKAIDAVNNVR